MVLSMGGTIAWFDGMELAWVDIVTRVSSLHRQREREKKAGAFFSIKDRFCIGSPVMNDVLLIYLWDNIW